MTSGKQLTDEQLRGHARRAGVEEIYDEHRLELIAMLDKVQKNGQGDLAGFLFAFSALSNEIGRRNKRNFRNN